MIEIPIDSEFKVRPIGAHDTLSEWSAVYTVFLKRCEICCFSFFGFYSSFIQSRKLVYFSSFNFLTEGSSSTIAPLGSLSSERTQK